MIPYEIDPSLHSMDPALDRLDDGFSPPADPAHGAEPSATGAPPEHPEDLLGTKSPF